MVGHAQSTTTPATRLRLNALGRKVGALTATVMANHEAKLGEEGVGFSSRQVGAAPPLRKADALPDPEPKEHPSGLCAEAECGRCTERRGDLRQEAGDLFPGLAGVKPDVFTVAFTRKDNPSRGAAHTVVAKSWQNEANAVYLRRGLYASFSERFREHYGEGGFLWQSTIPLERVEIGKDPAKAKLDALRARVARRDGKDRWFACPSSGEVVVFHTVELPESVFLADIDTALSALVDTLQATDLPSTERHGYPLFRRAFGGSHDWDPIKTRTDQWRAVGHRRRVAPDDEVISGLTQDDLDHEAAVSAGIESWRASGAEMANRSPMSIIHTRHYRVPEAVGLQYDPQDAAHGGYLALLRFFKDDLGYTLTNRCWDELVESGVLKRRRRAA